MERRPPLTLRRARARKWAGIEPEPVPDPREAEDENGPEDVVEFEVVERCQTVDVSGSCDPEE